MDSKKNTKAPPPAELPSDPKEESRALLGPDEERRRYRPPADDASVEDPLQDWPDGC